MLLSHRILRLSAYWYPFLDFCPLPADGGRLVRCDRFLPGTTFEQALEFYLYDKEIRLLISDALERIEIGMRASLVEVLGHVGHKPIGTLEATMHILPRPPQLRVLADHPPCLDLRSENAPLAATLRQIGIIHRRRL